jgi:hypothetical protein
MMFGGIDSNQTLDHSSAASLLVPFRFSAAARRLQVAWGAEVAEAVVSVVEVPGLAWFDQLAAAAAGDLAGGDQWFELAAAGHQHDRRDDVLVYPRRRRARSLRAVRQTFVCHGATVSGPFLRRQ